METYLEELIREGAGLKIQLDEITAKLREVNRKLEGLADFNGKKTAYLVGGGFKVTVQKRENVKWLQDRILQLKANIPHDLFTSLFKISYEPISKKTIDEFLQHGDHDLAQGVVWCREISPGAPQVTFEKLEE